MGIAGLVRSGRKQNMIKLKEDKKFHLIPISFTGFGAYWPDDWFEISHSRSFVYQSCL